MAIFVFNRLYKRSNGDIDDENVWVTDSNKLAALAKVESIYPDSISFTLIRSE